MFLRLRCGHAHGRFAGSRSRGSDLYPRGLCAGPCGWRGYALPRLASRFGLAWASLSLGALWALWHLPFFIIGGADKTGQSFPVYLLGTTAISVAMAWLYWRTGGSLLLTMLMHASVNNTSDIVPAATAGATNPFSLSASPVAWLTVGIMWIVAAWCLWRMRASAQGEFA